MEGESATSKALFEEAIRLFDEGKIFEALECAERLNREQPEFLPGLGLLGDLYLTAGSPQLAIDPLMRLVSEDPDNCNGQFLLGCALGRTRQFEQAIAHLRIANRLTPNNSEILRNLGWMKCMKGEVEDGRSLLRRSIKLNPNHGLAYNDLGASYFFTPDMDLTEAMRWLTKALEVEPNNTFIQQTWQSFQEVMGTSSGKRGASNRDKRTQ